MQTYQRMRGQPERQNMLVLHVTDVTNGQSMVLKQY